MADRLEQIERLRKRQRLAPESKVFAPLADLLRREGELEEALVLLEGGLVRHPDYRTAMVILGHTLLDAQRHDHACTVLEKVLDLDPDNFVALGLLARDACNRGQWGRALPWLERLVSLEPDEADWPRLLAEARAEEMVGQEGPPADDGSPAAARGPREFATMTMVDIYIEQGYYAKALASLRLLRAKEPDRTDIKPRMVEVLALLDMHGEGNPAEEPAGDSTPSSQEPGNRPPVGNPRRDLEKKHFADWINRIQSGEGNPS